MSKRIKKDIKHISEEVSLQNIRTESLETVDSQVPSLTIEDSAVKTKKSTGRKSVKSNKAVLSSFANSSEEDPELQQLLMQVDEMLTEMTKSKWLSTEYPSLQLDFAQKSKK